LLMLKLLFKYKNKFSFLLLIISLLYMDILWAATTTITVDTIGDVAEQITGSFYQLTKMITAGSYLAGIGFSIGAIMKFKQQIANPTQIPVGTPIALLFIASALLFLPSILSTTSYTMFGKDGVVAGPTGTVFE
jgi:intracellular multiplication protein IcmD